MSLIKKRTIVLSGFFILLTLSIPVTLLLNSKSQDNRQRASEININTSATPKLDPRISVSHVSGIYPNIGTGYLVAGARDALSLGFQTIEVFLHPAICWTNNRVQTGIYQTLEWCQNTDPYGKEISTKASSLRELALNPQYVELFNLPFKTFFITTETVHQSDGASYLRIAGKEFSQDELTILYTDFYNLSTLLLSQYKNTGKTFILQTPNEIDWSMLGGPNYLSTTPNVTTIKNATSYWNVIQNAINDAKKYFPEEGMHLYQGCEFNLVQKAMQGGTTAINSVIPNTYCDLYGYSAYDTVLTNVSLSADITRLSKALDYAATKTPRSQAFGNKNIYISEIGFTERMYASFDTGKLLSKYVKNALDWGVPYVNLWTLYDNECTSYLPTTDNSCPGYWMRKPSGILSKTYESIKNDFMMTQIPEATPTNTPTPTLITNPTIKIITLSCDPNKIGSSLNNIDDTDYSLWKDEYSKVKQTKYSDCNNDNSVDILDFNKLRDLRFFNNPRQN